MTPPFTCVALLGTGLVGSSMGLAMQRCWPGAVQRRGWDLDAKATSAAASCQAIDLNAGSLEEAVEGADLVVLAAPVQDIIDLMPRLAASLRSGTVVTDVGGSKVAICDAAARHLKIKCSFIGGHPMAGAEVGGAAAARADLFSGVAWILCPPADGEERAVARLKDLVRQLGARPLCLDAAVHDAAVARVSYLPQILAVALLQLVGDDQRADLLVQMAGRGFADLTRVGSSPFGVWRDVLATNRGEMLAALDGVMARLRMLSDDLQGGAPALEAAFMAAARTRSLMIPAESGP